MRYLLTVLLCILGIAACRQKLYECTISDSPIGAGIMLTGFSRQELDTVYLFAYADSISLMHLQFTDTFLSAKISSSHDSASLPTNDIYGGYS